MGYLVLLTVSVSRVNRTRSSNKKKNRRGTNKRVRALKSRGGRESRKKKKLSEGDMADHILSIFNVLPIAAFFISTSHSCGVMKKAATMRQHMRKDFWWSFPPAFLDVACFTHARTREGTTHNTKKKKKANKSARKTQPTFLYYLDSLSVYLSELNSLLILEQQALFFFSLSSFGGSFYPTKKKTLCTK